MEILNSKKSAKSTVEKETKPKPAIRLIITKKTDKEGEEYSLCHLNFSGSWNKLGLDTNGIAYGTNNAGNPCILVMPDTNDRVKSFSHKEGEKSKTVKYDDFVEVLAQKEMLTNIEFPITEKLVNYFDITKVENDPFEEGQEEFDYETYEVSKSSTPAEVIKIKTPSAETIAKITSKRAETMAAKAAAKNN